MSKAQQILAQLLDEAEAKSERKKTPELLLSSWLTSAVIRFIDEGSYARSFHPFGARFSRDIQLDEALLELLDPLRSVGTIGSTSAPVAVANALTDSLAFLADAKLNLPLKKQDRALASRQVHSCDCLFRVLDEFDSEASARWASFYLNSLKDKKEVALGSSTTPFPIMLHRIVSKRGVKSEERSRFFTAMYQWAYRNPDEKGVNSIFPKLFVQAIESLHGEGVGERMFEYFMNLLYVPDRATKLSYAERIQHALELNAHTARNEKIKLGFYDELNATAWPYISHKIRELGDEEKESWSRIEFLRKTFSRSLNVASVPDLGLEGEKREYRTGGLLEEIVRSVAA